ncbi:MAG: hypothetical protein ACYDBB_11780 [Armatimonadota bacterium]
MDTNIEDYGFTPSVGYLAVFNPYKEGEPLPQKIERLGDGIIKVTTVASTDYVFCAVEKPVVYKGTMVDISAYAGAVRIYMDKVVLANTSGLDVSVAYQGMRVDGMGPCEQETVVSLSNPKRSR